MSDRKMFLTLITLDVLCFGVAMLGHLMWKPVSGGPQSMQIWQLLAWIFAFALLLLIVLATGTKLRTARSSHPSRRA